VVSDEPTGAGCAIGTMKPVGAKSAWFSARLMLIIGMRFLFPFAMAAKSPTPMARSSRLLLWSLEVPAHLVTKII